MDKHTIEARIQAAIKPQLDECDRLLDYYTEGLPREIWRPIARELGAAPDYDEIAEAWQALMTGVRSAMHNLGIVVENVGRTIADAFEPVVAWQDPEPLAIDTIEQLASRRAARA
jgi:hypothetical protein